MKTVAITPLEDWIRRKIGLGEGDALTRSAIDRYQRQALNRTLAHVRKNSPFYQTHLADCTKGPLKQLDALNTLPFTSAEDLRRAPLSFLCVSQAQIARAVTLKTSGTTGTPKRLFFTAADQELTVDFFHHGMATFVQPGGRVLILLPGVLAGSVGDLLVKGLARLPARGIVHGPVLNVEAAIDRALEEQATHMVGIPVQVLAMASHPKSKALRGQIDSILLSTDYVPDALVARIENHWQCRVYKHYGMTEMGFGGGVECVARKGYHLREADLLVEIVDPATGQPIADGRIGEVVVTTLARQGMPLIRYRTGDLAAFESEVCPCGAILKTLGPVRGRRDGILYLKSGQTLCVADLDETLFAVDAVVDYRARLSDHAGSESLILEIVSKEKESFAFLETAIEEAVLAVPGIQRAVAEGQLGLLIQLAEGTAEVSMGAAKREIRDYRERIVCS